MKVHFFIYLTASKTSGFVFGHSSILMPYGMIPIFLCSATSKLVLGLTQPPIQWVPEALSLGREASGIVELYLHSPNMSSWLWHDS
jgi:hypothetical protein